MKLSITFVLFSILGLQLLMAGNGYGQGLEDEYVTMEAKGKLLPEVLKEIENRTSYRFAYNNDEIKDYKIILENRKRSLSVLLELILADKPLKYNLVKDKFIVVTSLAKPSKVSAVSPITTKRIILRLLKSPDLNISGTVTDQSGEPLIGVNIVVKGTNKGTSTDFDGRFTMEDVDENAILLVSYVGYETQAVPVAGKTTLNIALKSDAELLDEVVVVGYGTMKRKDVTGSVASVEMDKLTEAPVANFDQALAGRVTGVQVSSGSGKPGDGLEIVIRGGNTVNGDNSPLYVLDGFIIEDFNPGLLDPSDIQSIDILKDASATAIYGARGANGVVLITTREAKFGKTKISYETRVDVKEATKKLDVLDAYEYLQLAYDIDADRTASRYFVNENDEIVGSLDDYKNAPTANWQDEAFRRAISNSHKLSISSGGEKTKLSASLNYMNDQGTLIESSYSKYNGRLNLRHKLSEKLDLTLNAIYANTKQLGLDTEGNRSYSFMRSLIGYYPVVNKFIDYGDRNPLYGITDVFFEDPIFNWHPIVSLENEYRNRHRDQLISNLALQYKIKPNLVFETKASYNGNKQQYELFNNSNTVYGRLVNPINGINGRLDFRNITALSTINTLTFRKSIGNSYFNIMAGYTLNSRDIKRTIVEAIQIPQYAESQGINAMDEGTLSSTDDYSGGSRERTESLLARLNYTYKKRYLLTASIRRDGSSRFAPGHNIGYFPSLAVSWKMEQEDFVQDLGYISQLKLKAGYGKTGNDRIPSEARFDLFTSNLASYFLNGQEILGQRPTSAGANPNVEWETTSQYNAGLDVGFFDDRLSMTVEAYKKITENLLINADTPPSLGISTVWQNSGTVNNRGLEFSLSTTNISTDHFKWSTDFNISFNKNMVASLPEDKPIFANPNYYWRYASNQYIVEEGQPLGNMYGYLSDGVYQPEDFVEYDPDASSFILKDGQPNYRNSHQPGDEKYKDLNGDGMITASDKTIIGNGLPIHYGGFGNYFSYKGFDLGIFFQWSYGNDILNANKLVFEEMQYTNQNQYATVLDRWTPDNQDTDLFRARGRGFEDVSSRIVEDGSYLRLKTINLSYNLPKPFLQRLTLSAASIFVAAQNMFTWTGYSGFDPDVSVASNRSPIMQGVDYSAYPPNSTISIGLNVSF